MDDISRLQQAQETDNWNSIYEIIFLILTPVQDADGGTTSRWVQDSLSVKAGDCALVAVEHAKAFVHTEEYAVNQIDGFRLMAVKLLAEADC